MKFCKCGCGQIVKNGFYYSDHSKYGAKYCACGCGQLLSSHRYIYKIGCHQRRELNNQWKGGEIPKNGYIYVLSPQHPNATKQGYVAKHRLVVEAKIGRFLVSNEVVHHINGDTKDNRLENLQVMTKEQHHSLENTIYTKKGLICRIKKLHKKIGRVPHAKDFVNQIKPFYRVFGSWNNALIAAGFSLNRNYHNLTPCSSKGKPK